MKKRYKEIDILRGIAVFSMILIHTNAYFLSNSIASFLWDNLQFAVPLFIFSSSYIFFLNPIPLNIKSLLLFAKKRLIRLLVPYYFFAVIFLLFVYRYQPIQLTFGRISESMLLWGGIDINWLILLFAYFILLMPLIQYLYLKQRLALYLYTILSLVSSIIFIFNTTPFNYRLLMWIPWSLIILFSLLFVKTYKKRGFSLTTIIISSLFFIIIRLLEVKIRHPLSHYQNKYPPTFYHLSYGVLSIVILYWLTIKGVFNFFLIKKLLVFLSYHSYEMYFIHYVFIYILTIAVKIRFSWMGFFITVTMLSIITQLALNRMKRVILPFFSFIYSPFNR